MKSEPSRPTMTSGREIPCVRMLAGILLPAGAQLEFDASASTDSDGDKLIYS